MKRKNRAAIIIFCGIFMSLFACGPISRPPEASIVPPHEASPSFEPQIPKSLRVVFSHNAGFYDEPFDLTLSAPEGAVIYYTLDGSPPNTSSTMYTRPIFVDAPAPAPPIAHFDRRSVSRVTVFSINAVAVRDGEVSQAAQRNFVMGEDVFTRFCGNTLIFTLNSDPHGLYDHYDGILVPGIDRELFRQDYYNTHGRWPEAGYGGHQENPGSPANFNRRGIESERPVFVEMFDHRGVLQISQRAGMRVKGGYSRADASQKSLELYARVEYGDRNNFRFPFFLDEYTDGRQFIDRYRRVRLRNGGSDRSAGFIRDELSQTLFRQAGHSDTQTHTPAAVFLNGEYYGAAWLKTPRSENHLARRYGGVSENFEFVSGGDNRLRRSWWVGEQRAADDLHQVSSLAMEGVSGDKGEARFEEFSRRIDVDGLNRYYAMQIYINNYDWPNHNIEMWRYFPADEEKSDPDLHPYLRDGRWRVYSHDIESAWAIWDDHGRMMGEDTLRDILTGENSNRWNSSNSSAFLYALVGREDTKARLANTFVDLIEGAFAPANVIQVLDGLIARIENEHNYALRMNLFNPDNPGWPSIESVGGSREAIRRFARGRPDAVYSSIRANLGYDRNDRFTVSLTASIGGGAVMNSRPVGELQTVEGNYFTGTEIIISARPHIGYTVDYWTVNGVPLYGDAVTVGDDVNVTLYFRLK